MDYRLENLDDSVFENLVNTICQNILGFGTISFSSGKDGGRDGKFQGTAQNYPSSIEPWKGRFIIQAKHTINPVASCSDKEFETIVEKEIPKIKKLRDNGEIDNYMLFTNRKYSAIKGEKLLKKICNETGVENSVIIGKETINDRFLNPNKALVRQYDLLKSHIAFDFSDEDIREVILAFKEQLPKIGAKVKAKADEIKYDFSHIEKEEKNEKNKLGEEYYKQHILGSSLMEFDRIEEFLKNPINEVLKEYYYDVANELNQLITLNRNNFDAFEELFVYIYQNIQQGVSSLKGSKRHITVFLHYMYIECLIGKK